MKCVRVWMIQPSARQPQQKHNTGIEACSSLLIDLSTTIQPALISRNRLIDRLIDRSSASSCFPIKSAGFDTSVDRASIHPSSHTPPQQQPAMPPAPPPSHQRAGRLLLVFACDRAPPAALAFFHPPPPPAGSKLIARAPSSSVNNNNHHMKQPQPLSIAPFSQQQQHQQQRQLKGTWLHPLFSDFTPVCVWVCGCGWVHSLSVCVYTVCGCGGSVGRSTRERSLTHTQHLLSCLYSHTYTGRRQRRPPPGRGGRRGLCPSEQSLKVGRSHLGT